MWGFGVLGFSAAGAGLADNDDGARGLLGVLLFDTGNPQSIRRRLLRLEELMRALPKPAAGSVDVGERRLAACASRFAALDLQSLVADLGPDGELARQLAHLDAELRAVAERIEQATAAHRRRSANQLVQTA